MGVEIIEEECPKCGWGALIRSISEEGSILFCEKCGFIIEERRRVRIE